MNTLRCLKSVSLCLECTCLVIQIKSVIQNMCAYFSRASNTDYAKANGGKWDFIVEKQHSLALPLDEVC